MSTRLAHLNDIVAVLDAGAEFYRDAARRIGDQEKEAMFVEHAELRESIGREIAAIVDSAGAEPSSASPVERARHAAARVGAFFGDVETNLVQSLEDHEDKTLSVFRKAINNRDNAEDEPMLRQWMHAFEESHDRMRVLKQAI